ncbi:MAG TPA: glucoamylase family protein, partial [Gemmatimonadales bacterium]|nr:glucoamylase family protein [Gemmatimonadales bacterium]
LLVAFAPAATAAAAPILVLWLASPAIAWGISRPLARREARLTPGQSLHLGKLARRTWAFFDTYVGAEDHWLPPDNFQEHPVAVVAHRTSPTNIGLALLANLTAHDFGYIPAGEALERTASTLGTMASMQRHEGHFFNWYDTLTLEPLLPRYVSAVDSGNLAGHLVTLRAGLLGVADGPVLPVNWVAGLSDTLLTLAEALGSAAAAPLARMLDDLEAAAGAPAGTIESARTWLERLDADAVKVAALVAEREHASAEPADDATFWARALVRQSHALREELELLAPAARGAIPTLRAVAHEEARAGEAGPAGLRLARIDELARQCEALARMDYGFLYDRSRHLLAIGYNVAEARADAGYYDLLASEARFGSFVAIAQGELPQENWFALGRLLTSAGGRPALLSWSGSMFEYLMPLLVMPAYEGTLLDRTCRASVERQIAYGRQRGVPWGISECGYNSVDAGLNYQYRAFGVPGLGLKRGLADDLVIAPYASALALMVAPG